MGLIIIIVRVFAITITFHITTTYHRIIIIRSKVIIITRTDYSLCSFIYNIDLNTLTWLNTAFTRLYNKMLLLLLDSKHYLRITLIPQPETIS